MRPPESSSGDFRALQADLAAHLRDPAAQPAPKGVDDRGLAVYRDLVYRNIESAIAAGFPVIRRITADTAWHARVRDFFARHRCEAPQYNRIAEEFVHFLETERGPHADDPPFLAELARHEWVELALGILDEAAPESHATTGDLLGAPLCVSPLAWTLSYVWPVHRIGPDFLPASPPQSPTYLVAWRDAGDDVRFMEVNALTARLMQLCGEQPGARGRELIEQMAEELKQAPALLANDGRTMIQGLIERGCLVSL